MQVVVGSVTPPRISLDLTGRPGEQQDIEEKKIKGVDVFFIDWMLNTLIGRDPFLYRGGGLILIGNTE